MFASIAAVIAWARPTASALSARSSFGGVVLGIGVADLLVRAIGWAPRRSAR